MTYNFQQWMSRLPQRWRTQRNAIRNTNCKTSWIIKILNAHCAPRNCLGAYLSECLWTPLNKQLLLWIRKSNCLQEELGQYQGCQLVVGLCCCCCSQASAAMKFVTKSICNCCSSEWPLHIILSLWSDALCCLCTKQVLLMSCSEQSTLNLPLH